MTIYEERLSTTASEPKYQTPSPEIGPSGTILGRLNILRNRLSSNCDSEYKLKEVAEYNLSYDKMVKP